MEKKKIADYNILEKKLADYNNFDKMRWYINGFVRQYNEHLPEWLDMKSKPPTCYEFLFNYVQNSYPFIIRYAQAPFPAVNKWNNVKYLRKALENEELTVCVTPIYSRQLYKDRFIVPKEIKMNIKDYMHEFEIMNQDEIYRVKRVDNNFFEDFKPLREDVLDDLPWVTEAFGYRSEALTIWMQDHRYYHTMRRQAKEHFYYNITGIARFLLYPPFAVGWMPYETFHKYQWVKRNPWDSWRLKNMFEEQYWISYTRQPETKEQLRYWANTKPYSVDLIPGDCLYVPPLWYLEIQHSCRSIMLDYRYETKYDIKYPSLNFALDVSTVKELKHKDVSVGIQTDEAFRGILLRYMDEKYNPKWRF